MTAFVIEDAEWALMRKVDHLARDLYVSLRRRMDFATGIVGGAGAAVSWWALREDTELEGRPGVRGCKPSEQQLRRRIEQLEKVGLVERIGSKLRLRFRLLLARRSSLDQKKAGGGETGQRKGRKAKQDKALKGCAQGNSSAKAGTHQESGKTNTLPNPSRDFSAPAGMNPPPHACGTGGEQDPQHQQPSQAPEAVHERTEYPAPHASGMGGEPDPRTAPGHAQQLSEQRPDCSQTGEGRPSAELAEGGLGPLAWEEHLAWPVHLRPQDRRYMAQLAEGVGPQLFQRVLDELRGAMQAAPIRDPWAYLHTLLRNAKEKGDAWQTIYADKVAQARQKVAQTDAATQAKDAEWAAVNVRAKPGYPGAKALRELLLRRGRR